MKTRTVMENRGMILLISPFKCYDIRFEKCAVLAFQNGKHLWPRSIAYTAIALLPDN